MKIGTNYRIRLVDNVLDILETISNVKGEITLSYLSNKLKISKNALFRILKTLEMRGYVEPSLISGKYLIGSSAFNTGRKFLQQMDVQRIARQQMKRLVSECNESVYLALLMDTEVVLFDVVMSTQRVQITSLVGRHFQQDEISAGKIFRAYGSTENLPPELTQIRADGLSIDHNELDEGVSSISVPLFNYGKKVIACLCMVGPTFRLKDDYIQTTLLPSIKSAAQTVSTKLGFLHNDCDYHTNPIQKSINYSSNYFSNSNLISNISKKLGVTPRTIRLYEAMGLIDPPERSDGGKRYYDKENIKKIECVLELKELGLSLLEIRNITNIRKKHVSEDKYVSPMSIDNLDALSVVIREKMENLNSLQGDIEEFKEKQLTIYTSSKNSSVYVVEKGQVHKHNAKRVRNYGELQRASQE